MAQNRKYENLPDLDRDAPDIYETPELTEDTTLPSSTARSPSQASSYDESDDGLSNIDRRHLEPGDARAIFQPARVDAKGVDFSDRIRRQRRSYRTASRRHRRGSRGSDDEYGDFSDEDDETLERKLARLRREVEEVKQEVELREQMKKEGSGVTEGEEAEEGGEQPAATAGEEEDEEDPAEGIAKLSEMLDAVYVQRQGGVKGAEAQFTRTLKRFARPAADATTTIPQTTTGITVTAASEQAAQALSRAADFDARLSQLEKALGLNANNMPDIATHPPKSILHNLDTLERQLQTISEVSTSSLDAASRRVQKLTQEAERLDELRRSARASQDGVSSPVSATGSRQRSDTISASAVAAAAGVAAGAGGAADAGPPPEMMGAYIEDPERVAKINALYGTLTTIESLSPTLPLVLERLRTLRLIHTSAGTAAATLDELEKRQGEQAEEIRQWSEALTKVEENLKQGEGTLQDNIKTVGDWVRDLEARIAKFA
ncbi:Dynactin subunit 2 protein [Lasiodiplodia theobromae]|uniref:Dynactin subunit 2 protein n=1 Tax=Lasiodiplodia theobromae TaxID=45133 RepID=UPI0015C30F09|nr:Dynactin subunit 2 protein [Lasiodiplodia theobromae]KAF4538374.1 Dynactin subunit 2 protein [Lasiodiplodia theobromae]